MIWYTYTLKGFPPIVNTVITLLYLLTPFPIFDENISISTILANFTEIEYYQLKILIFCISGPSVQLLSRVWLFRPFHLITESLWPHPTGLYFPHPVVVLNWPLLLVQPLLRHHCLFLLLGLIGSGLLQSSLQIAKRLFKSTELTMSHLILLNSYY